MLGIVPALHPDAGRRAVDRRQGVPRTAATPGWVGVGFIVSDAGVILLLIVGILLAVRRQRVLLAVPVLTAIYVVALGVAWVSMTGKP